MDAVGDVANGHLVLGPARKQRLEDAPADFPVQLAHTVDPATAPQGQIGHGEWFLVVIGILPSQGHQFRERDAESIFGVTAEMLPHQIWREAIKAGFHRGVRREEVAGASHLERHLETVSYTHLTLPTNR